MCPYFIYKKKKICSWVFVCCITAPSRVCSTYGGHSCGVHHWTCKNFCAVIMSPFLNKRRVRIIWSICSSQVYKAQEIGSKRGKLSVEDFLYLMRKVHYIVYFCVFPYQSMNLSSIVIWLCNMASFILRNQHIGIFKWRL